MRPYDHVVVVFPIDESSFLQQVHGGAADEILLWGTAFKRLTMADLAIDAQKLIVEIVKSLH